MQTDPFFKPALGIKQSPLSARLRQRFDEDPQALTPLLDDASVEFLQSIEAPVSPLKMGHIAQDMGVIPMDNCQTHKEGVSYTYKGYDDYAPMAAYLGQEGSCLGCEPRPSRQHANKGFLDTLERVLPRTQATHGQTHAAASGQRTRCPRQPRLHARAGAGQRPGQEESSQPGSSGLCGQDRSSESPNIGPPWQNRSDSVRNDSGRTLSAMDLSVWPTLSRLCCLPRPLSRSCFLWLN